jgi:hypothetical protein
MSIWYIISATNKLIRNKDKEMSMPIPKVLKTLLLKYATLWTHPEAFFKAVAKEKDYWQIIAFVAGFAFLGELVELLLWWPLAALKGFVPISFAMAFFGVFASLVLTVLGGFLAAAVIHLGVLVFHGQEKFFSTWKVVAYASIIPVAYNVFAALLQTFAEFLNPFPDQSFMMGKMMTWGIYSMGMTVFLALIGLVILVHIIYAEVMGLSFYHKLPKGHACIATVVSLLIVFLLVVLLFLTLAGLPFGMMGMTS